MKRLTLFATLACVAMMFASCSKIDYKSFVGTWGVEKIEYYNIDFAGHPIAASMETYNYNPEDANNSIQLVFRQDKTGEMRDGAVDTLWLDYNEETQEYETVIHCPDTILVNNFTYTFDESESALYMTIVYTYPYVYSRTFKMKVSGMTNDSFIYENEYDVNYMEKAYLKRISNSASKSASRQIQSHPRKRGALLGDR